VLQPLPGPAQTVADVLSAGLEADASTEALVGDGVYQLSRISRTQPVSGATNQTRVVEVVHAEKQMTNGLRLVKEFELSSNYLVGARVLLENRSAQPLALPPQQWIAGAATPLNPQDDEQWVGLHWYDGTRDKQITRAYFDNKTLGCFPGPPLPEYRIANSKVAWATAHSQFFFLALIPKEPATELSARRFFLPPPSKEEITADSRTVTNQFALQVSLHYPATNLLPGVALERQFTLFAGPKEYRTLERIGAALKNDLDRVMGYGGFFGFFSRFLLLSMNGLNALGLSYGLAIIVITIVIKLLFWPLTQASTRSMKRLQALQPQMKAIQEKYKDDPAKMNKKVMEFMKEHKVSPLGGCLPLMLQIPVFIGFFKMVQSAIELRGAKFLWACDLSRSDTVFVIPGLGFPVNPLPLLMGLTMLWQASLTPPSPGMDPAQQKIMKYFPLIFLFIRARPPKIVEITPQSGDAAPASTVEVQIPGLELPQAVKTRSFWLISLVQLLTGAAIIGMGPHYVGYLTGLGYSPASAASRPERWSCRCR